MPWQPPTTVCFLNMMWKLCWCLCPIRFGCGFGSSRIWEPWLLLAVRPWHPHLEFCRTHRFSGAGKSIHLSFVHHANQSRSILHTQLIICHKQSFNRSTSLSLCWRQRRRVAVGNVPMKSLELCKTLSLESIFFEDCFMKYGTYCGFLHVLQCCSADGLSAPVAH